MTPAYFRLRGITYIAVPTFLGKLFPLEQIWHVVYYGHDSFMFFPMLSTPYMICANEPLSNKEIIVYSFKSSCSIIVA